MFKNMDYLDTYSTPEFANIRYPSTASQAINGWAYVFTQDQEYVQALSKHHIVEVRFQDRWAPYDGKLPNSDDLSEQDLPPYTSDEASDPNY